MMLFILLQVFCLCSAQSQDNSTNNFGSGFDPISLNTSTYKTLVLMTTESYTTKNTGTMHYTNPSTFKNINLVREIFNL